MNCRLLTAIGVSLPLTCVQAQIDINPGLSGGWYEPATAGQGLVIDVIPSANQVFAGCYTFAAAANKSPGSAEQRWLSAQGPYAGSVAELILYSASGGVFDTPTEVTHNVVGTATLNFHNCTDATYSYSLPDDGLTGSIELIRLGPDVYCQEIVDAQVSTAPEYNQPPRVSQLQLNDDGQRIQISYAVADDEDPIVEISVAVLYADGSVYPIPAPALTGNVGYPVIAGAYKQLIWNYLSDPGFAQLGISQFRLRVSADDRFAPTLQQIVDLVSEERLIADIQRMQGVRHHSGGPNGLAQTRDYLRAQMNQRGITSVDQPFQYQGSTGINIIGNLVGTSGPNQYYLVDGHYDTVSSTPGADDNASGTAGMLEVMRVLSQFHSEKSIRFVGFDKEELGLRGSRYYAANLPGNEQILGMINFEMIGYTCTTQPECQNFPNADTSIYNIRSSFARSLSDSFLAIGSAHVPGLKITAVTDDGDPNFRRSDHAPFWDLGVDALFLSDGANFRTPHYHQASDRLEFLDTEFMANIVKTTVGTLARRAGVHHRGEAVSGLLSN